MMSSVCAKYKSQLAHAVCECLYRTLNSKLIATVASVDRTDKSRYHAAIWRIKSSREHLSRVNFSCFVDHILRVHGVYGNRYQRIVTVIRDLSDWPGSVVYSGAETAYHATRCDMLCVMLCITSDFPDIEFGMVAIVAGILDEIPGERVIIVV